MASRRNFLSKLVALPLVSTLETAAYTPSVKAPKNEYIIEAGCAILEKNGALEVVNDVSILVQKDKIEKVVEKIWVKLKTQGYFN